MNPVSAPLARVGDINLVSECLTIRNTTLGDANSTIVPGCLICEHAMMMERAGVVEVIGRTYDKRVIDADGNRRRAVGLHKNGKEERESEKN